MSDLLIGEQIMNDEDSPQILDAPEDGGDGAGGTPPLELGALQLADLPDAGSLSLENEQPALATDNKVRPPGSIPTAGDLPGVCVGELVEELEPGCDDGFLERYVLWHERSIT